MFRRSRLKSSMLRARRDPNRGFRTGRLGVELLEDRRMLAVATVDTEFDIIEGTCQWWLFLRLNPFGARAKL